MVCSRVAEPKTRRKHRRVRNSWSGCHCPDGSKRVQTSKTRGWSCLKPTAKGPRFVRAVCNTEDAPKPAKQIKYLFPKPKKPKRVKVDWSVCECPTGAELVRRGKAKVCVQNGRMVKAVCPLRST